MGLLTTPSQSEKVPTFIKRYHGYISTISFIIGSIWFAILANNDYNAETYFSENALLPGLVDGHFYMEAVAEHYLENLNEEIERYHGDMPTAWLRSQFNQLGLEVYLHNFTLHYPFGNRVSVEGNNVYAIFRAPRAASTEALVLCAPFRSSLSVHPKTSPGIAIMLALAKYFKQHTYWAKDIIYLISDHEQLGAKAWLEAYHSPGTFDGVLDAGLLTSRSGAIQAAINIEFHGEITSHVDIKIEGLNAQLPNLDLFNLAVRLCHRENVPVTFKNRYKHYYPHTPEGWLHNLGTMLAMVRSQATGIPNGNHALFLQYNIQSLTLEGHATKMRGASLTAMARVLEGIFRSLNNLLESFHQSYFFYLLPSTNRYVSIGLYMPPFGLIILAIAVTALKHRIESQEHDSSDESDSSTNGEASDDKNISYSFISVIPNLILSHGIGIFLFLSPSAFDLVGRKVGLSGEDSIFYGVLAVFVSSLLLPVFINRSYSQCGIISWKVLKYVTLLEIGLLLGTVSVANFSLAMFVSFFSVPVILTISPTSSRYLRYLKAIFLILISPISLAFLPIIYDTFQLHPRLGVDTVLQYAGFAFKRALLYSVTDYYIYSNWMYCVTCVFHFSTWIQLWCMLHMPVEKNLKHKIA